jgi:hypothetical protein
VILRCKGVTEVLEKELDLCEMMLRADERNFHCWNYRTWLIDNFTELRGNKDELEFTSSMIYKDFSNFSAWHYRTKVIELVYADEEIPEDFLAKEFDLLKNAYFTCPYDQSIWNYHRWLYSKVSTIKVTSIWPRTYAEWPTAVYVGFSVPVADVSTDSVAISSGWEAVSGTWSAN